MRGQTHNDQCRDEREVESKDYSETPLLAHPLLFDVDVVPNRNSTTSPSAMT
jgi:hypothetical protein